jgi:hypothetical protein
VSAEYFYTREAPTHLGGVTIPVVKCERNEHHSTTMRKLTDSTTSVFEVRGSGVRGVREEEKIHELVPYLTGREEPDGDLLCFLSISFLARASPINELYRSLSSGL